MISVKLPAVNLQSSTETTSHPRSLPGQGPTYTSIHSPTSLTKIGTEGGEFLAPLPYGIFFSILYLGHEVRRKYLCPIILEERLARFFPIFFHPSNPSIFFCFFFLELSSISYSRQHSSVSKDIPLTHFGLAYTSRLLHSLPSKPLHIIIPQFYRPDGH